MNLSDQIEPRKARFMFLPELTISIDTQKSFRAVQNQYNYSVTEPWLPTLSSDNRLLILEHSIASWRTALSLAGELIKSIPLSI